MAINEAVAAPMRIMGSARILKIKYPMLMPPSMTIMGKTDQKKDNGFLLLAVQLFNSIIPSQSIMVEHVK